MLRSTRTPETATEHHHRPSRRRNDRGLTTLEWLLIVAAVAGLAALAVVLVQNVVDDTAEQISGSSARLTAARVAAAEITEEAKGEDEVSSDKPEAKAKCERLRITYGDAFTNAVPPAKVEWFTASSSLKFGDADVTPTQFSCHIVNAK